MPHSLQRVEDRPFYDVLLRIVGPILIMLMIASLVFFLIEAFYRGPHEGRLRWVFGLFTAATVLVSRISIEEGLERAAIFGFALGGATLVTAMTLVDFDYGALAVLKPVVLILFIVVVMWSANRLTWDCTMIDDSRDVSSIGLTEIIARKFARSENSSGKDSQQKDSPRPIKDAQLSSGWLFLFFVGNHKSNTPGLWVVYFSLAAFPIFGMGQWLAQAGSNSSDTWIFGLFAVYLASGMGLLMLTSLTGLERYLDKRGAQMPSPVSRNWLVVGTVFAIAIMVSVLVLPRPKLGNRLEISILRLTSPDRQASENAFGNDGQQFDPAGQPVRGPANEGQNDAAESPHGENPAGHNTNGKSNSGSGESRGEGEDSQSSQTSTNSQSDNSDSSHQEIGEGQRSDRHNDSVHPTDSESDRKQESSARQPERPGRKSTEEQRRKDEPEDQADKRQAPRNQPAAAQPPPERNQDKKDNRQGRQNSAQPQPRRNPVSSRLFESLAGLTRYFTYAVGVIVLFVLLWMFRQELLRLWQEIFARERKVGEQKLAQPDQRSLPDQEIVSFDQFRDPFRSGAVERWQPRETIAYTFQALESWAWESGLERDLDETPFEFAAELAGLQSELGMEAKFLAELHGRCHYGLGGVAPAEVRRLERLWRLMQSERATTEAV
jgi:hypothetical protein